MPGAETGVDEFEAIARLLRPLSEGAPGAFSLTDDAAVIAPRDGYDLVVSADALVEGVHFLASDPLDLVARKLLRVNLSDLAAKAAEPFAYMLTAAWPPRCGWPERAAFARGLAEDQARFGVWLLGGDTSSTSGPLTLSVTIFGWAPTAAMVRRAGAQPGDRVLVSGTIGDGRLGLEAARGTLDSAWLADRYRLPEPRLELRDALRAHAHAAADVSDGLIADAGHIAEASGVGIALDLDLLPVSEPAQGWVDAHPSREAALVELATGGDDYEVVCAVPASAAFDLIAMAEAAGLSMTDVGEVTEGSGVRVVFEGSAIEVARTGWRHN